MPAAAVGSAHGVVRTHRVVPRDRQSEKMRAPSPPADMSPKIINFGPKSSHARSMADSLPWPFPSGKPWHQFVGCGCRAGPRMPTYSRRHPESAVGWLRSPVRSFEPARARERENEREREERERRERESGIGLSRFVCMLRLGHWSSTFCVYAKIRVLKTCKSALRQPPIFPDGPRTARRPALGGFRA